MSEEIEQRVDRVFLEYFGQEALEVFRADEEIFFNHDAQPVRDVTDKKPSVLLDSLDRVEFVMAMEDEFNLDISEEKTLELKTRFHVIEFFEQELGAKQ